MHWLTLFIIYYFFFEWWLMYHVPLCWIDVVKNSQHFKIFKFHIKWFNLSSDGGFQFYPSSLIKHLCNAKSVKTWTKCKFHACAIKFWLLNSFINDQGSHSHYIQPDLQKNVVLKAFSSNPSLCKDKMVLMREVLTIFWQGQTNIFHLSLDIYFVSGTMC